MTAVEKKPKTFQLCGKDAFRDKLITLQIGRRAAKGRLLQVSRPAANDSNGRLQSASTSGPETVTASNRSVNQ